MLVNESFSLLNENIGKKLKQLRKERGITTKVLGRYIGVSQQQISRYELGINHINIDALAKFSELFQVPISSFTHYLKNE